MVPAPPSSRFAPSAAFLFLGAYVVGGAAVPVFMRYLTFHFDQFTQNFYRLTTGAVCLAALSLWLWPAESRRLLGSRRALMGAALIAVGGVAAQALYVEGVARTSAAIAGLLFLAGLPLSVIGGALAFADERESMRGPRFYLGAPLGLAGAVGLAIVGGSGEWGYSAGVGYLLASTVIGAGLGLLSKRMVLSHHPVCVSALITTLMCPLFLVGALIWGNPGVVKEASAVSLLILFASGAYGLVVGSALYYVCLQRSGLVVTRFGELAMPVFTALGGYLIFQETLTPGQVACGALLLAGCALVGTSGLHRSG